MDEKRILSINSDLRSPESGSKGSDDIKTDSSLSWRRATPRVMNQAVNVRSFKLTVDHTCWFKSTVSEAQQLLLVMMAACITVSDDYRVSESDDHITDKTKKNTL